RADGDLAISDAMVWRHTNTAIDDPSPAVGSFNMAGVHCLSAHVIKLRDIPEDPTLKDLVASTPSSNIVAKAEASQKRKASTSGATSSHVAKRTRSALAQSSSSTTRPSLFVGDDDEIDDACVEITLITPLHSAAVIPSLGNQGRSFAAPTAEGSNPQDSRGKGVMVDVAAAPSAGASRSRPSSGPAPSFRNVSGDAIHMTSSSFLLVLTMPLIIWTVLLGITIVDQFPTPGEMVRVESLSDDQLTAKMSVMHWFTDVRMVVSGLNDKLSSSDASFTKSKAKGKERKKKIKSLTKSVDNLHSEVACLFVALNQATVLKTEKDEEILRLKTIPLEFSSFFHSQFQGLVWKFLASDEFSRVQGELLSIASSVGFEYGLSMHRTKDEFVAVLKKMTNFMPGAQDRLTKASPLVAQTDYAFLNKISEHATEPLSVILQLEPEKLVRSANVPASREVRVSPPTKESTVTPASKSLELSTNVNFTASTVASEHNEEMVNVEVDGSDPKMTDDAATVKSGHAFVQELVEVGSGRVSSGTNDVVVALFVSEKGDGLDPSSATGEEAAANPFRV
ncbi:hypothetical protein Tco_1181524, partial [Tanacetum coccineum]